MATIATAHLQLPGDLLGHGRDPARVGGELRPLDDRGFHLPVRDPPPPFLVVDEVQLCVGFLKKFVSELYCNSLTMIIHDHDYLHLCRPPLPPFAFRHCHWHAVVRRLGLDDDGTPARYFCLRSPCGASMSTVYCRLRARLSRTDCPRTLTAPDSPHLQTCCPPRSTRVSRSLLSSSSSGACLLSFCSPCSPKYSAPLFFVSLFRPTQRFPPLSSLISHLHIYPTRYLSYVYFLRSVPASFRIEEPAC